MRSWRNRQTRTVEGRVRESMGSSPFDRTKGLKPLIINGFNFYMHSRAEGLSPERESNIRKEHRRRLLKNGVWL